MRRSYLQIHLQSSIVVISMYPQVMENIGAPGPPSRYALRRAQASSRQFACLRCVRIGAPGRSRTCDPSLPGIRLLPAQSLTRMMLSVS